MLRNFLKLKIKKILFDNYNHNYINKMPFSNIEVLRVPASAETRVFR